MYVNDVKYLIVVTSPYLKGTIKLKASIRIYLNRFEFYFTHLTIFDGGNLTSKRVLSYVVVSKHSVRRIKSKSSWQNLLKDTFSFAINFHDGVFYRKNVVVA